MAPVFSRQFHSLSPAPPSSPKGPSTTPVPVTKSIDPTLFAEFFAGTVGIFVLAVLFWKIGRCMRSFNRHKVLEAGRPQTARYARTWYGWVSLSVQQRNKRVIRNCFACIRRCTAWRSSRVDYRWVWWDPGQKEFQRLQQARCPLVRWLPKWFRSYDFTPADDIWNPGPPPECHGALLDTSPKGDSGQATGSLRQQDALNSIPRMRPNLARGTGTKTRRPCQELFRSPTETGDGAFDQCSQGSAFPLASHSPPSSDESLVSLPSLMHHSRLSRSIGTLAASDPCLILGRRRDLPEACAHVRFEASKKHHGRRGKRKSKTRRQKPVSRRRRRHRHSYRVWSTKMQMKTARARERDWRESSGPPGTPATELLFSRASEQIDASYARPQTRRNGSSEYPWESRLQRLVNLTSSNGNLAATKWNSAPVRYHSTGTASFLAVAAHTIHGWHSLHDSTVMTLPSAPVASLQEESRPVTRTSDSLSDSISQMQGTKNLSDWEERLLDRLDRKLVWLFNEFTPGQKPFHFALLANHWLNRETWIVMDPVSRVPIDARREWGDPRFNVPYPEPQPGGRRCKHPAIPQTPARIARIDSWRDAVNKQRRASGVRGRIRTVQLFNESVDEPPDGKTDPACWILPRPPQGFEMSTKQKNAWYEGGAGWQEKLEDWQQVKRGYRVRKAVHEGRVNRTRVKELATQIQQMLSQHIAQADSQPRRQTKPGLGLTPRFSDASCSLG